MMRLCSKKRLLIALLAALPLMSATASAGEITIGENCQLADAIVAANLDAPSGGCPAGDGEDVIRLTGDVSAFSMLPPVTSPIILRGNGHTLSGAKRDRLLRVRAGQLDYPRFDHHRRQEGT